MKFPPAMRSGNYPVICDGVKKVYGSHLVFHDVTLTINRGEKVAFVGKNGEGKSTLVKCIMDEIPYEGKLTIGHNVQIGYFAQNQAQMLDENLSVFDTIDYVAKGDIRLKFVIFWEHSCLEARLLIKSKGTVGWGAESSCHDKTFVRTGEFPYFGRTYQPSGYALKGCIERSYQGI